MASGFDIIKRGIVTNNMKLVIEGYELMTGDEVEIPRRVAEDDKGVTGTGMKKKLSGKPVQVTKKNLFVDVAGEARAQLSNKPKKPVRSKPRSLRESVEMLTLKCSRCRDSFIIASNDESLKEGRKPVCNDCVVKGSR